MERFLKNPGKYLDNLGRFFEESQKDSEGSEIFKDLGRLNIKEKSHDRFLRKEAGGND